MATAAVGGTTEVIDGRTVMYISDPFVRKLLEEILTVLKAQARNQVTDLPPVTLPAVVSEEVT